MCGSYLHCALFPSFPLLTLQPILSLANPPPPIPITSSLSGATLLLSMSLAAADSDGDVPDTSAGAADGVPLVSRALRFVAVDPLQSETILNVSEDHRHGVSLSHAAEARRASALRPSLSDMQGLTLP